MEIVINKKTYQLKNVNAPRKHFFATYILPNYNYQKNNFEEFLLEIQKELVKNHKINQSIEQIRYNFFRELSKNLNKSIWMFLDSEAKKEIGIESNLDVSKQEMIKFIEWVCEKIRKYAEYVGPQSNKSKGEDVEVIYSFLAKEYGWSLDEMKEMDELEVLKALEQAIELKKRDQADNINSAALAGAYAGGSKKAKTEIDKINRNLVRDKGIKNLIKNNPNLEIKNELSREQLQQLINRGN